MLSKQAILEYKQIYKKTYGKDISDQEALTQALKFLRLFQAIYKPIPLNTTKEFSNGKNK